MILKSDRQHIDQRKPILCLLKLVGNCWQEAITLTNISEYITRKEKIDVFLDKAGWNVNDQTSVVIEVDTKQSDFKKRNYKTVKETLHDPNTDQKAYADYLLLDNFGSPLAVIEAKRTSKDPILGQKQAEGYADDIERQTGKDVFIFLTNGYEIWFWNRTLENQPSSL
jgi:type I restriction enzyme R subunit